MIVRNVRNTSWNHTAKHFIQKSSPKCLEQNHKTVTFLLLTSFFRSNPPELKGVLQIYSYVTGELPCRSVCDFNDVAMQFYWNKRSAEVLSCKFAAYF